MKANIRFDHQLLAVESEHHVHAMLELVAPAAPKKDQRPPLQLALVIDRSGSMGGPKLAYACQAASFLVERMVPSDELALITYDDEVQLLRSMAPVDKTAVVNALHHIYPGGTTNLSGGWLKGIEELRRSRSDQLRKVLLLTDGLANHGITDHDTLVDMARTTAEDGVGTTTIGFGEGFDEELLTDMADAGQGNSYYVASPEDAPGVFAQEFEDLSTLVAQNVSVEIRPSEEVKLLGVLNEYPATSVQGGLQLNLGDAYGEDLRRIVFELHIPQLARLGLAKVADVVVRYVTVGDEVAAKEITIPVNINMVNADEASSADPDQQVIEEVMILKAARAQKEARGRADTGDFGGAQELLRKAAQELRAAAPNSARAQELLQDADLMEGSADMAAPDQWTSHHSKNLHFNQRMRHQGRQRRPKRDEN